MINQEKLKEIETFELCSGMGKAEQKKLCIMQAVDYISCGGTSDHPECACPVLTWYCIRLNDCLKPEHRQLLKPFIPLLVETRLKTEAAQIKRIRLLRFRNVTATYPLVLEMRNLNEVADKLRTFENTVESMAEAAKYLATQKEKIYAYAYADAYATADAYADAYAYAYADAYAYAYAYANADALREKIVATALETLKMALEIKDEV